MIRRVPPGASIVTADAMRAAEARVFATGVSQDELMEAAGAAVAIHVVRLAAGRPVLVLAGPGNNGGDAYVAARHLVSSGSDVTVAALGSAKAGAAARMRDRWTGPVASLADVAPRAVVVDGMLGIGAVRAFDPASAAAIARLSAAAELRIAIDVPSGRDADSGGGSGDADVTIALGALKPVHVLGAGAAACGHVLLADIGVPVDRGVTTIHPPTLPSWPHDVNKFSRGMVAVVGGEMAGASVLAASGAMAGGAGYTMLAGMAVGDGPPHALVRRGLSAPDDLARWLEDDRIGAAVIGPGLGRGEAAHRLLDLALASGRDLVIDGDALSLLGRAVTRRIDAGRRRAVLTPHAGEFARMFDADGDKISVTVAAARESGAIVVHKGADTVIGYPDGRAIVSANANPGLSVAGSGDVLAGVIAARLAAPATAHDAVAAGVWLHARAADGLGPVFGLDTLLQGIPGAIARCPIR